MTDADVAPSGSPAGDEHLWDTVGAAALVTHNTGMTTLVLIPRRPTIVAWARYVARRLRTPVTVEVTAGGVEIQFRVVQDSDAPELCPMADESRLAASRQGVRVRLRRSALVALTRRSSWFIARLRGVDKVPMILRGNPCPGHISLNREHTVGGAYRDE